MDKLQEKGLILQDLQVLMRQDVMRVGAVGRNLSRRCVHNYIESMLFSACK